MTAPRGTYAALFATAMVGCGPQPICDAESLRVALSVAAPGEVVELGECTITGSFEVPPGVIVAGQGPQRTRVVGAGGTAPALELLGGAYATTLRSLSVEAPAPGAIHAAGGSVAVLDVEITLRENAFGLVAASADEARVERLRVVGAETADALSTRDATALEGPDGSVGVGLHVRDCPAAQFVDLEMEGLLIAVKLVQSNTRWNSGWIDRSVVALRIFGGTTELAHVASSDSLAVFNAEGRVTVSQAGVLHATDLLVENSDSGNGVSILDGSIAQLTDVAVTECDGGGIRVSGAVDFALEGTTSIRGNAGFGLLLSETLRASIRGAEVSMTRRGAYIVGGGLRPIEIADGIALVQTFDTSLSDIILTDNARVGLFIEACNEPRVLPGLANVRVEALGDERGAYATLLDGDVRVLPPAGWDIGVTRLGDALANDATGSDLDTYNSACGLTPR